MGSITTSREGMSRRNFLRGAAGVGLVAAASGALAGCAPSTAGSEESASGASASGTSATANGWLGEAPQIDESEITATIEADIVVVGGGNAGVMCACAAAENGASVAVIESQPEDGIFYYGLHDIASINSEFVLADGLEPINKSEFLSEYQRRTHNKTNPRLVKKFIDNSGEMMDWLVANAPAEVSIPLMSLISPPTRSILRMAAKSTSSNAGLDTCKSISTPLRLRSSARRNLPVQHGTGSIPAWCWLPKRAKRPNAKKPLT